MESKYNQEFYNAVLNWKKCTKTFFAYYDSKDLLEKQVKREDINRICFNELNTIRQFAKKTDLAYDALYL